MRLLGRDDTGGGGGHDGAAVLGAVGLGGFAGLVLPDHPPNGLALAAAYDDASGRISVSLGAAAVSASPAELAGSLGLHRGPVGLAAAGADAAVFSSAEAIAAVLGFVRYRVLLEAGEDGGAASGEVAAALRLVEEGRPYDVDWGGLVWAVVKGDVVAGTTRRYAPYLLRLMELQRPELLAEDEAMPPLCKRWKGQMLQQCQQWIGEEMMHCVEPELKENEEEGTSFACGLSQDDIGDLEEMPIFGQSKEAADAVPVDCNSAFWKGEEIHGLSHGNAELGSQKCLPLDGKLLGCKVERDDGDEIARGNAKSRSFAKQDGYTCPRQVMSEAMFQPGSNPQCMIEINDEDGEDDNVNVGPSIPLVRDSPWGFPSYLLRQPEAERIRNYHTPSPFETCMQKIRDYLPAMDNEYLLKENACRDTRAEVEIIKKLVEERVHKIAATENRITAELQARAREIYRLEHEKKMMHRNVQQCKMHLKKCLADFEEYRKSRFHGEGGTLCAEVAATVGEQNRTWVQQVHHHQLQTISRIDQTWSLNYVKLSKQITEVEMSLPYLNHDVQRLKHSRLIPDLNNGMEEDGEGEASPTPSKEVIARAGEGQQHHTGSEAGW